MQDRFFNSIYDTPVCLDIVHAPVQCRSVLSFDTSNSSGMGWVTAGHGQKAMGIRKPFLRIIPLIFAFQYNASRLCRWAPKISGLVTSLFFCHDAAAVCAMRIYSDPSFSLKSRRPCWDEVSEEGVGLAYKADSIDASSSMSILLQRVI